MLTAVSGHRHRAAARVFLFVTLLGSLSLVLSSNNGGAVLQAAAPRAGDSDSNSSWSRATAGHSPVTAAAPASYPPTAAAAALPADLASVLDTPSLQDLAWPATRSSKSTRQLLQSSTVETACSSSSGAGSSSGFSDQTDPTYVLQIAEGLLGDSRLRVTDARLRGSCSALGSASFSAPHAFAAFFPAAVVLSTGDAMQAAGEMQEGGKPLSTDLYQPGDPRIGAYTHDAAVLEIDISTSPAVGGNEQLVLSYMFGSEEYGTKNPNPDMLSITISSSSSSSDTGGGSSSSGWGTPVTDLAVLPGGGRVPVPSTAAGGKAAVQVFSNNGGKYRTSLNGFTQVVPSQGYAVQPGSTYTLRIAVADANHGLVDSVLMLPAGAIRLAAGPTAVTGGPYAVAPNSKLTMHGAKSHSPNGAVLSYRWTITPNPALSSSSSSSGTEAVITATGASVTVATPPTGDYNVTLEVWDTLGAYSSAVTALSVDPANVLNWWSSTGFATPAPVVAQRPAAVLAVNGSRAEALLAKACSDGPAVVDLDGSGSHDGKGSALVYKWSVMQTEPVVKDVEVMTPFLQPPRLVQSLDPGVYLVTLEVSGPGGSNSKQVLITVAANSAPVAMPGGPYTATVGKPVMVDAGSSTDPDGDPMTFSWTLSRSGGVIGRYNGSTLSMTLNKPGSYGLLLTVRDDRGGVSSASTEINSYITPPAPPAAPVLQRTAAAVGPAAVAAVPAPANARVSAASIPQGAATTAATPQQWGSVGTSGGYESAGLAGVQSQAYGQLLQQQQQQLLQTYQQQQQQQPIQQQQQLLPAGYQQLPYQQLQHQQQMLAVQQPQQQQLQQQQYLQTLPASATQLYTQQPYTLPQQQQQAIPTASATPGMPSATPGVGMCLFKDGKPDYNPWNAAAAIQGRLAGAYWGPCPMTTTSGSPAAPAGVPLGPVLPSTSAPTAPAPAAAPAADGAPVSGSSSVGVASADKAEPVQSIAGIRSPEAFVMAEGAATQVFLDAGSSAAAPGRSIVAYHWTVHSKADNSVITSVDGQRTPVWLGPGEYSLDLQVTDTSGQIATAKRDFAVGDVAATLAHITSPAGFVELSDGGSIQIQLSAAGSKAGPGRSITSYSWVVTRLPDNGQVASGDGPSATASLPGGTYKVQLTVGDSGGGHATASTNLAIGGEGSTGATAVISWPPTVVQATAASTAAAVDGATTDSSSSSTDGTVMVPLDASGSQPARSGSTIRQYVWAVLSLPDRQPVGNATGRSSTIRLPPGLYQAGLLVLDADGGTATARKNFVVQQGPVSNRAPVIAQDIELTGASGDKISIPDVTDPDADTVTVSWSLMNQVSGLIVSGKGLELSLEGLNPGSYLLLITAADGRGGESSGTAHVMVTPAKRSTAQHGASGEVSVAAAGGLDAKHQTHSQQQQDVATDGYHNLRGSSTTSSSSSSSTYKAPGEVASIFSGPSGQKKLPVLSMPQGSVLSLDAAAFHLLPPGAKAKSFAWELQQRGTGQQVATVYGRIGRFELPSLASYNMKLLATDTEGDEFSSTGSVRVLDASDAGDLAAVLDPHGVNPVVSVRGQCGPFKAAQYAAAVLSCPELEVGDNSTASWQWAWKVTPIAIQPSSSSSSRDIEPRAQAKLGKEAAVLGLEPGLYRVELAVGVGQEAPSSKNTAYYLATFLQVAPTRNLTLSLPPSAVCSGQPVSLEAPPLQLLADGPQPELVWRVTQTESLAHAEALVTTGTAADSSAGMQGTGKTFGFTAIQPGRYEVSLVAKLPDGTSVTGEGVLKVKACVGCYPGPIDVVIPRGTCAASDKQAAAVLTGILPAGLEVSWAEGTDVSPGLRNVTITAQLPGARARDPSGRAFLAPSCRALVNFQDKEAPRMTLLYENGLCLSPPNNKWNCWHAHQLVSITDNCQSGQDLSFKVSCGRHSSQSPGVDGSSSSTCQVLQDGRICVKAADVGQITWVSVVAKDSHGNVADPLDVSVKVRTLLEEQKQCSRPDMLVPGVAAGPIAVPAPAEEAAPAVGVVRAAPAPPAAATAAAAAQAQAEEALNAVMAARAHKSVPETPTEAKTEPTDAAAAAATRTKVARTHRVAARPAAAQVATEPATAAAMPAAAENATANGEGAQEPSSQPAAAAAAAAAAARAPTAKARRTHRVATSAAKPAAGGEAVQAAVSSSNANSDSDISKQDAAAAAVAAAAPAGIATTATSKTRRVHRIAAVTEAQPAVFDASSDPSQIAVELSTASPTAAAARNRPRKVRSSLAAPAATGATTAGADTDYAQVQAGNVASAAKPSSVGNSSTSEAKAQRVSANTAAVADNRR